MHQLQHVPGMLYMVFGYLIILTVFGTYCYNQAAKKGKESRDDFLLAGRGLGKLVAVGTTFATFTGGGTVTGGGNSLAYLYGLWPGICFCVPPIISFTILIILAKRIRESGFYTVSQLLEVTYGRAARYVSAVIIALAFVSIVSYQYRGLGFVLNVTTGMSIPVCTIICTVLVIGLAYSGGLKTVAATDALSAFLMLFGIVVACPLLLAKVGGFAWIKANATPDQLSFFGGQTFFKWLGAYLPLTVLTIGDQNYFQRITAAKDLKTARIGCLGCIGACIIVMPIIAVISMIGRLYFGSNIAAGQSLISTSTMLPVFWGGILLSAASAFIITTGDSYLLSAASNFTVDIYGELINKNATDKNFLHATRGFILVAGVVAYIILQFYPSILAVQYMSYTIYGAAISPAVIAAVIWPRVTKAGGLASMLAGSILTIIWEVLKYPFGIQTILVVLPVSILVLIFVSLVTKPNEPAVAAK